MTLEARIQKIELALAMLQSQVGYMGLCVNASLHPDRDHPHWDDDDG